MRRWILLAANLYPRAWRVRYGEEFQALLEDVDPGLGNPGRRRTTQFC